MATPQADIGMIGLGVMGRNLLLNMADHGFTVAGLDKDPAKVEALRQEAETRPVRVTQSLEEMLGFLRPPRAVMMLVPAGAPVDTVIRELLPRLAPGDIVIDGGNSFYQDTNLRIKTLAERGIHFLGVGISGGEEGARHGPCIMPGGDPEAYERVRPIFEAVAAWVNGDPCIAWTGPGAAGHYVKMIHNGIEYGLMELLAEAYDLMRRGLRLNDDELHEVFDRWNEDELNSYLVEITARIFCRPDERTNQRLIDVILDQARQKGTGMWAVQDAMELRVPTPTIDMAVAMRDMSDTKGERVEAARVLDGLPGGLPVERAIFLPQLKDALFAAMIITYAQGLALLRAASAAHQYNLNLEAIARIWRGGCIIRAAVLEDIRHAYHARADLHNLLLDEGIVEKVSMRLEDLRAVVQTAAGGGIPVLGFMSALGYYDAYRSDWLPANLLQAQRDYFGAHTYERVDAKGTFHTEWAVDSSQ